MLRPSARDEADDPATIGSGLALQITSDYDPAHILQEIFSAQESSYGHLISAFDKQSHVRPRTHMAGFLVGNDKTPPQQNLWEASGSGSRSKL